MISLVGSCVIARVLSRSEGVGGEVGFGLIFGVLAGGVGGSGCSSAIGARELSVLSSMSVLGSADAAQSDFSSRTLFSGRFSGQVLR